MLKAYGAEVVVCPTAVEPEHPDSYYSVSDRLVREIEGAWKPNQYANPNNPRSHYETTGPEIWKQTDGRITHFVAGVGTGGTISGIGRYLKEQNPDVQVVGADPAGSVYSGGTGRPYLVEGVGEDFWPSTYDRDIADRIIEVSDADSFAIHPAAGARGGAAGRRLVRHGGVRGRPAGPRARRGGPRRRRDRRAAAGLRARLPRQGVQRRVAEPVRLPAGHRASRRSARCCAARAAGSPTWCTPTRARRSPRRCTSSRSTASRRCPWSAPSRRSWPPRWPAAVSERSLLDALFSGDAALVDRVEKHMDEPLPTVGASEPVSEAVAPAREGGRAAGAGGRQADRRGHPAGPAGLPRHPVAARTDASAAPAGRSPRCPVTWAVSGCRIAASASTPSTSRGPGRAKDALASTAHTGTSAGQHARARPPPRPATPTARARSRTARRRRPPGRGRAHVVPGRPGTTSRRPCRATDRRPRRSTISGTQ